MKKIIHTLLLYNFGLLCLLTSPVAQAQQNSWLKELFRRGEIELQLGDFKSALSFYNRVIAGDQRFTAAYFSRGKTYLELKNYDKAREDFTRAGKQDPSKPEAFFYLGASYYQEERYEEALPFFDLAIKQDSSYAIAYNYRAESYRALGFDRRAIQDYDQAIKYEKEEALLYLGRAKTYLVAEQYTEAFKDLAQAINLEPRLTEALRLRAETAFLLNNYSQAAQDVSQLEALKDTLLASHYYRLQAFSLGKTKAYPEAIAAINKVIADSNETLTDEIYAERAGYHLALNQYNQALEDYHQALSISPQDTTYLQACADIVYYKGSYHECIIYLNQILNLHRQSPHIWYQRGLCHQKLENTKQAKLDFREAAQQGFPQDKMNEKARKYTKKIYRKKAKAQQKASK